MLQIKGECERERERAKGQRYVGNIENSENVSGN